MRRCVSSLMLACQAVALRGMTPLRGEKLPLQDCYKIYHSRDHRQLFAKLTANSCIPRFQFQKRGQHFIGAIAPLPSMPPFFSASAFFENLIIGECLRIYNLCKHFAYV